MAWGELMRQRRTRTQWLRLRLRSGASSHPSLPKYQAASGANTRRPRRGSVGLFYQLLRKPSPCVTCDASLIARRTVSFRAQRWPVAVDNSSAAA